MTQEEIRTSVNVSRHCRDFFTKLAAQWDTILKENFELPNDLLISTFALKLSACHGGSVGTLCMSLLKFLSCQPNAKN